MTSLKKSYAELIELTKLYILQEHALDERIFSSLETFTYFRNTAKLKGQAPKIEKSGISENIAPSPIQLSQAIHQPNVATIARVPPFNSAPAIQSKPATQNLSLAPENGINKSILTPVSPLNLPEALPKPVDTKNQEPANHKKNILLEAVPPLKKWDLTEIGKQVSEHLPSIRILSAIPPYVQKELATAKSYEILILCRSEEPSHKKFLNNIKEALQIYGKNVKFGAEKLDLENALLLKDKPLLIASKKGISSIEASTKLFQKENSSYFLYECPLILLEDIERYFLEPSLKIALWHALKEHLKIS